MSEGRGNEAERRLDRTGWPAGEWDNEPDRVEWRSHGLPCLIVRNDLGTLCGYVGVPPGHPLHGGNDAVDELEVHGGVTYGGACAGHICHVPREGEPDDVWWIGFDCGHGWDFQPGLYARLREATRAARRPDGSSLLLPADPLLESDLRHGTYRPLEYVRAEVERLAEQCAAVRG